MSGPDHFSDVVIDGQITAIIFYALIPVVVAFSFIVFVFYRARREAFFKQKEAELKLSISEIEMKALRSQMNPHFIFNCLNSIHHFMHSNDPRQAGEYLIKFSQLIRHVLETSYSRMIVLSDDLKALKWYMELEQLRLNHAFEFEIDTKAVTDADNIQIPPLLIQPFVENSIWHGLSSRGRDGRITITIKRTDEMLRCVIEDNGVEGSKKEPNDLSLIVKKTSLGMSLINDRLDVVNRLYKVQSGFTMHTITDDQNKTCGKRVELTLPFED